MENGRQLQAQNQEMIYLPQKRLKRDFFLFLQRDSKKVTKKRLLDPQKSLLSHFGGQKVSFWSFLSLFVERGKSLFLVSFGADKSFLGSGPVAACRFHRATFFVRQNVGAQPKVFCFRGWKSPQGLHNRSKKEQIVSGGGSCLEEGRLGLPGQVWELRFLGSCPLLLLGSAKTDPLRFKWGFGEAGWLRTMRSLRKSAKSNIFPKDPSVLKIVRHSFPYFATGRSFTFRTVFLPLFPRKTSTSDVAFCCCRSVFPHRSEFALRTIFSTGVSFG